MRIAMIGLGRMGANMARRLRARDIEVVGLDRDDAIAEALARDCGVQAAASRAALVAALAPPRIVWLMLPAGAVTGAEIDRLQTMLAPGDLLIDGANSHFKDSMTRAAALEGHGIGFVDAGVSGGIWGRQEGYTLMLGGPPEAVGRLGAVIEALAPAADRGWLHCGPAGSGHFVKMIHNGIEYGLMQAYAEGFALLRERSEFALDLAKIAETWRHGSVVRSWLLDLTAAALAEDQALTDVMPFVADSGEGRWAAIEAIERGVPAPVISTALMMRFASQGQDAYAARLLALLRRGFGGHAIKAAVEE
jgi:6-phosphogluconate dehydrogenase